MTLEECYEKIGGDYREVLTRLDSRLLVVKYLKRVPEDESSGKLFRAMREHRLRDAFLAAHTLKGFALTMGLSRLADRAGRLTERLREGRSDEETERLVRSIREEVTRINGLIGQLDEPEEQL